MLRRNVELKLNDSAAHRRKLAEAINKLNLTLQIRGTLTLGVGSVIITDRNIGKDAVGIFTPADSTAATTNIYAVASNGQIEIFNAGGAGGVFNYLIVL